MARMTWLREIFYDESAGDPEAILKRVAVAEEMVALGDSNLALHLLQGAALRSRLAQSGSQARARVVKAAEQISSVEWTPRALTILSLVAPLDSGARISHEVAEAALVETTDGQRMQLLAFAAYVGGDIAQAIDLMNRAVPLLRAQGRLSLLAQVLTVRAWAGINTGNFTDAAGDAEEAGRLATETEQPLWIASSQIGHAALMGLRGEERIAEQVITEAAQPLISLRLSYIVGVAEFARGITAMTVGRNFDACDHFIRMFDPEEAIYHGIVSHAAACYVVEAAVRAGRHQDAQRMMALLEAWSKRTPATLIHAGVRYGRAVLAEDSRAEGLYELALKAEPTWPFHHARLQMSYGSWLRRQRRITESRPYLRTARDTFEALGVHAWADKARAELRASGERLAEPTKAPRQSLSPQELQIAQMAASGLSNREIGDRLFLSHRTVGAHLYRVFPKLGIASRSELSGALASREPALT
jgi:ATP/maltotriose-dependent transcriptional regulator MalT